MQPSQLLLSVIVALIPLFSTVWCVTVCDQIAWRHAKTPCLIESWLSDSQQFFGRVVLNFSKLKAFFCLVELLNPCRCWCIVFIAAWTNWKTAEKNSFSGIINDYCISCCTVHLLQSWPVFLTLIYLPTFSESITWNFGCVMTRIKINVLSPQVWDSRIVREGWQVCTYMVISHVACSDCLPIS